MKSKTRIKLSPTHISIALIGMGVLFNQALRAGTNEALAEPESVVEQPPTPGDNGVKGQNGIVLTRATYLLEAGRKQGSPQQFARERYQTITTELQAAMQQQGVFDGDAKAFSQLANLNAELQATELVLFWLDNPDYVHLAHGYSFEIPTAPNPKTLDGVIDYASITP
ncbi:MAG: hypothetical protein AAF151_14620 [Cyanobacteria bacterium J06656_5]